MKRMLGLIACGLFVAINIPVQAASIGVGYRQMADLDGIMLTYDQMFSDHFGVEGRASFFSGETMTDVDVENEQYYKGELVYAYGFGGKSTIPMDVIPLEVALKAVFPTEKINFYMLLGAGYYIYDSDESTTEDVLGYFGAVGLEIKIVDQLAFFASIDYTQATWETDEETVDNYVGYYGPLRGQVYESHNRVKTTGGFDEAGLSVGLLWIF